MTGFEFDQQGNIREYSAAEYQLADEEIAILAYTHGTMHDGRPYYAYVAVKPSLYKAFYAKTAARESMLIGDYGTVVAGGFEESAPPHVVEQMRALGFNDDYEANLMAEAQKQLKAHLDRQEVERIAGIVDMLKTRDPSA